MRFSNRHSFTAVVSALLLSGSTRTTNAFLPSIPSAASLPSKTIEVSIRTSSPLYSSSSPPPPDNKEIDNNVNGVTVASPATTNDEEIQAPANAASTTTPSSTSRRRIQTQPPSAQLMMRALNTSPRRIFLSLLSSSFIALTANFFGITSNLLTALPQSIVESSKLDLYYPRGNYKRHEGYVNNGSRYGYSLNLPKEWVADTALEIQKAQRRAGTLDYTMGSGRASASGGGGLSNLPDAAFGPPGKFNAQGVTADKDTPNVSIIISPNLRKGFTLQSIGSTPTEAANLLLQKSLTPVGSGKVGTLLNACEERRGDVRGSDALYQFEYRVDRGSRGVPLRAISVIAVTADDAMEEMDRNTNGIPMNGGSAGGGSLITMTVIAPESLWETNPIYEEKLRTIANSFKVIQ